MNVQIGIFVELRSKNLIYSDLRQINYVELKRIWGKLYIIFGDTMKIVIARPHPCYLYIRIAYPDLFCTLFES